MTLTFGYADSSGGARICCVTEPGMGTPVLVVSQTWFPCASVLAHYSGFIKLNRGLSGGATSYTFDWRGTGKSTKPPGKVAFSDLVDDVEAVAEAIGEPFDLFAVNDACGIALAFAVRRPELVRRLMLVAPQGERTRAGEEAERGRRIFEADPVMALYQFLMWVHPGTDPAETFEITKEALAATLWKPGLPSSERRPEATCSSWPRE